MRKKLGFTLAEVLITLGIIGVIAALTAPALVKNSGRAKVGPALSKFVSTFETACEQLMVDENTDKLTNIGTFDTVNTDEASIFNRLSKYLIMTPISGNYKSYETKTITFTFNNKAWQLKNGSVIIVPLQSRVGNSKSYPAKGVMKGGIGFIYYDIDGVQENNYLGKDVFLFVVDDSGMLVPYYSQMHQSLTDAFIKNNNHLICEPANKTSTIGNAQSCTGRIADNGWKAD